MRPCFDRMKPTQSYIIPLLAVIVAWAGIPEQQIAAKQPAKPNGIQPLIQLKDQSLHELIPPIIRPLLTSEELEQFLRDLEGRPPEWQALRQSDQRQQSDRLFKLNRQRDQAREAHRDILEQPVAFLWSGMLRKYLTDHKGFSMALGPELTATSWGMIRFKPVGLPDYLVAIPPPELMNRLQLQQQHGTLIEVVVLFIGTLVPDESLIYGFSHDHEQNGMILPVVHIQDVKYILRTE